MISHYNLNSFGHNAIQFAGLLVGFLLTASATEAGAADWSFDPKVAVSGEYNDNDRLTAIQGQEIKVSGGLLDAQLTMSARTPQTTFTLVPRMRSSVYPGDEPEEANDQFLRMMVQHDGQRTHATVNASYVRLVTLGSYFPVSQDGGGGIGDPDPGTGIDGGNLRNREELFLIDPQVTFDITQRQMLTLGVEYLDVGYDREITGSRVGFSSAAATASYRVKTSETASVALSAGAARYESDLGDQTNSYEVSGEWAKHWSATAEVFVRGGANFVAADQPGNSGYNSGFSGGAGVRWKFEVTDLFLDANQYLDPNSSGKIVTRTQLRAELVHQLGPKTSLTLGAKLIDDSGAPGDSGFLGKQYAAAGAGFSWRMTRAYSLFGRYQYRWKDQDGASNRATSNGVSVGVAWEPKRP